MRCIFACSVIAFVANTGILAIPESKSLDPTYDGQQQHKPLNNTRQSDNESIIVNPQRALLIIPRIPPQETLHGKSRLKKCQPSTLRNEHGRQLEDCNEKIYTIFSQTYVPTIIKTNDPKLFRDVQPDNVNDWNNDLTIHGLWPQYSKVKSILSFTPQAIDAINQHHWPILLKDDSILLYTNAWNKFGVKSGLFPLEYIRDINHLHHFHSTPRIIRGSTKETSIGLYKLKQGFHLYACLICKNRKHEKVFLGVNYCHTVNPKTLRAEETVVPYERCGICKMECNGDRVIIPKLGYKTTKCDKKEPEACKENEYTIFAQSYMPTIMTTGKKHVRQMKPEEVNDWNNNLKIISLIPRHFNVKPSTLPFTPQAAGAVNKYEWPTVHTQGLKAYEQQWDRNGRKTGLNPLEYVHETQRIHKLYPTPDFSNQPIIPLATLKTLFHEYACLICRPKDNKELFLAMHLCHKVNPKTRHMEQVVPFSNCGSCFACSQDNIIFPKLSQVESNRGMKRKRDTSKYIIHKM